jgi:type VI protein secretion system component VasK
VSAAEPSQEKPLSYRGQFLVRTIGALLLIGCAAMVVLGVGVWADRLQGRQFAQYWSWCFLLALTAIIVAVFDMFSVRRASRRSRRELFRQQFMSREFVEKLRKKSESDGETS